MRRAGWSVYMVRCADGTLYTGVARDARSREAEHNGGPRGAKYTRARRPVRLVYVEGAADRSEALRREAALRRLGKAGKEALAGRTPGKKTARRRVAAPGGPGRNRGGRAYQ